MKNFTFFTTVLFLFALSYSGIYAQSTENPNGTNNPGNYLGQSTVNLGEKTSFSKSQQLHLTHSVNIKETVFLLRVIQFKFVTGGEWTQMWNGN